MQKISKVVVVASMYPENITKQINHYIQEGYQPCGALLIKSNGHMVQKMVQYAEDSQL